MVTYGDPMQPLIPHIPTPSFSTSRRVKQREQYPSHSSVQLANLSSLHLTTQQHHCHL